MAAITLKIAKLYSDLGLVIGMTTVATGDALDTKAGEYGITRHGPTPARYRVNFEGSTPNAGERFFTNSFFFALRHDAANNIYYLEAEDAGAECNTVLPGTIALPVGDIEDLESATFGTIYEHGADVEIDESLRARVQSKISGPAENGNKEHYKLWCEEVEGVGRVRIYPLWNGPNTVKAVLVDSKGNPCSQTKISEVQNYVDPATEGYTTTVNGKEFVVALYISVFPKMKAISYTSCSSKRNLNRAATSRCFMLSSVSLLMCPFSRAAIRIRLPGRRQVPQW